MTYKISSRNITVRLLLLSLQLSLIILDRRRWIDYLPVVLDASVRLTRLAFVTFDTDLAAAIVGPVYNLPQTKKFKDNLSFNFMHLQNWHGDCLYTFV
jgi:hypothetical protein